MEFEAILAERRSEVEAHLNLCPPPADAYPPKIHEAIRYAALGGAKRLRPVLVSMTTELVGGDRQRVLDTTIAIELIHASTLLIDDLPSMDDARLRLGQTATHRVYGEAVAILASVALLVQAFDLVAANGDRMRLRRNRTVRAQGALADRACRGGCAEELLMRLRRTRNKSEDPFSATSSQERGSCGERV